MNTKILFFALFLSYFMSVALGWGYYGHFLVAQIAENELEQKDPELLKKIKDILGSINNLVDARERTSIEASAWPDGLKYDGLTFLNNWHFMNLAIRPENPPPEPPRYESNKRFLEELEIEYDTYRTDFTLKETEYNILYGLDQCKNVIAKSGTKVNFATAMMTRYLIHLVGDIHQPLHCTTLFNKEYPYGDLGGNKYNITFGTKTGELHQLWDWGLWKWDFITRPMNQTGFALLKSQAAEYTKTYPRTFFGDDLKKATPKEWSEESWRYSWKYGYKPLLEAENKHEITQEYIDSGFKVVQQRIAIAGYRLADTLIKYFAAKKKNE